MSAALETVLSRLDRPMSTGRDRWRAACPVCGQRNRSTLSVGLGNAGGVLMRCFKSECDPEAIANSLGLKLGDLFAASVSPVGPKTRRRLLTDRQALDLLQDEAQLVALAGSNIANGVLLSVFDRKRILTAAGRIAYLHAEARA